MEIGSWRCFSSTKTYSCVIHPIRKWITIIHDGWSNDKSPLTLNVTYILVFALLGFLSPSNRGALATVMIIFYVLFGFIGGFVSSHTYKTLGGEIWKLNIILTPLLVPG